MAVIPSRHSRSAWLRPLGWVAFGLWSLGLAFLGARWWWGKVAHDRLSGILAAPRPPAALATSGTNPIWMQAPPPSPPAVPLRDLPVLKNHSDDPTYVFRLVGQLDEFISKITKNHGVVDFVALMRAWDVPSADSMTQTEAAAEFLRRAGQFSDVIAEWKASLVLGPWEGNDEGGFLGDLPERIQALLGVMTQAHWRTGDQRAAMESWDLMGSTLDRFDRPPLSFRQEYLRAEWNSTLRAGFSLSAWNDAELQTVARNLPAADPLTAQYQALQFQRAWITDHFHVFGPFFGPPRKEGMGAAIDHLRPLLDATLISNQQRDDNLALVQHAIDRAFDRFDPVTGQLLQPVITGNSAASFAELSGSWLNQHYFYTARMAESFTHDPATKVVRAQTEADHAQLAIALERHRLETGAYPNHLESVAGQFPQGLPKDIATGEDHFYSLAEDGGFQLWGLGIDKSNNQADPFDDAIWVQPPPIPR